MSIQPIKPQKKHIDKIDINDALIKTGKDVHEALKALQSFSDPYQGAVDIKEPVWKSKVRS